MYLCMAPYNRFIFIDLKHQQKVCGYFHPGGVCPLRLDYHTRFCLNILHIGIMQFYHGRVDSQHVTIEM